MNQLRGDKHKADLISKAFVTIQLMCRTPLGGVGAKSVSNTELKFEYKTEETITAFISGSTKRICAYGML